MSPIVLPGFILLHCFLAITFVRCNFNGSNFAHFPNFKPPNMGEKLDISMYIFLTLANTPHHVKSDASLLMHLYSMKGMINLTF